MKFLKKMMIAFVLLIATVALTVLLFMQQAVFGNNPSGEKLKRVTSSTNYSQGVFQNVEPTEVMRKEASTVKVLKDFSNKPANTVPAQALPSMQTDLSSLTGDVPTIVWFGHSSYLIKSKDLAILVDPVFSGHASPISIFGKEFPGTNVYGVKEMPNIDILVLTHDHYDHLDYETIQQLHSKVKKIVAPLGVDAHLEHWGVPAEKITALDWWESESTGDSITLTAVPARHFSGRGFARGKTLWSAFVLNVHGYSIFIGGDSGYDSQFKKIGEEFGPFDIALLECGQYGDDWPSIHMLPEEVPVAAKDLGAKVLMPVHWAKFALAYHAWNEPIERLLQKAQQHQVVVVTPKIGEPLLVGKSMPTEKWWQQ